LDESFMNTIFFQNSYWWRRQRYTTWAIRRSHVLPIWSEKTPAIDGSKVLPYDQLNAELFYPQCKENAETTDTVILMASEVAEVMVKELRDPKIATSNYLMSVEGKFSWGQWMKSVLHF
jgi:hypothetical protein